MFNATPTNGGCAHRGVENGGTGNAHPPAPPSRSFALGAQANAYLSYRLAWDSPPPGNDTRGVALDFGALYYGQANAAAVADLLEASLGAWAATSVPSSIGDFTLFWTMMQHADGQFESLVKKGVTAADTLAAAQVRRLDEGRGGRRGARSTLASPWGRRAGVGDCGCGHGICTRPHRPC